MLCPQCKKPQPASARHCARCGALLSGWIKPSAVMHSKYTILRNLNKGGMGALYLASETIANRERLVVVKEMLDYYDLKDPMGKVRAQQRFETEAATLVALSVAGVPQIFDYFSEGGRNFIVMQFIEGQNLETGLTHPDDNGNMVKGKPYSVDQVCGWGVELCRILQALTAKNIIHMDIKPANLILDQTGDIWLVDFGTVKASSLALPGNQLGLTKPSIYGTMGYAPPEQIKGKPEPRSDVYALAATLYHLMTDDDPQDAKGAFSRMKGLPDDVAQALQKALVVDVRKRVTAVEFGRLLTRSAKGAIPFTWRDGTTSRQPTDLAVTANRNWSEARDYFTGGDWEKWLRSLHHNNLVASIQTIHARQPNADLGLDEFLRFIDPTFPVARLFTTQTALDAGIVPWKSMPEIPLRLENRGGGCLKGYFPSLDPALRVEPAEFVTHDACEVRIKIDSSLLSPYSQPQTLFLKIDAGGGGQLRLPIKLMLPEPRLVVVGVEHDFGQVYRGQELSHIFQVKNDGGSPFLGEARSNVAWMTISPQYFDCPPGETKALEIQVKTRDLPHTIHAACMQVCARAGRWDRVEPVQVRVDVSPWRTFVKSWLPPLLMVILVAAYGGFLGAQLGGWLGTLIYPMRKAIVGVLVGTLFGIIIYAFPSILIGSLGGLGALKGKNGALMGVRYGAIAGAVTGALAGWLAYGLLSWLGLLVPGQVFDFFGGLVGALAGSVLGGGLFFFSRAQN